MGPPRKKVDQTQSQQQQQQQPIIPQEEHQSVPIVSQNDGSPAGLRPPQEPVENDEVDASARLRHLHGGARPRTVSQSSNNTTQSYLTEFIVGRMENERVQVPSPLRNRHQNRNVNHEVAKCLQKIGDDLSNNRELNELLSGVTVTHETAYGVFLNIAEKVFSDNEINWGRIVTLFYFAYKLVLKVLKELPLIDVIIGWVLKFFKQKVEKWIRDNGGWVAVTEYYLSTIKRQVLEYALVFSAGMFCYWLIMRYRS